MSSARRLIRAGASSFSVNLRLVPPSSRVLDAGDELAFWFRHVGDKTQEGLRQHIRRFLAVPGLRQSEVERAEWLRELRKLLRGDLPERLRLLVDSWAYRWFNIGTLQAHMRNRRTLPPGRTLELIAANNPPAGPDQRTTPFCQRVHGRVLSLGRVRKQAADYFEAVRADDVDAAKAAWPLLSAADVALTGRTFDQSFAGLGMPPYHHRCRTQVLERVRGSVR